MILRDCYNNFDEPLEDYEKEAREQIIDICVDIALDFGDEIERPVKEVETDIWSLNNA